MHMRSKSSFEAFLATRKFDDRVRMAGFDPAFVEHMVNAFDFMATSGLYGVFIALLRCAAVDLYGRGVRVINTFKRLKHVCPNRSHPIEITHRAQHVLQFILKSSEYVLCEQI